MPCAPVGKPGDASLDRDSGVIMPFVIELIPLGDDGALRLEKNLVLKRPRDILFGALKI